METLTFVERAERKLYCFIEACDKLFTDFSRSTVRLWLKNLEINTIYATLDERRVFKDSNPKLKSSVFGLIYENDLQRLLSYRQNKRGANVAVHATHRIENPCWPTSPASIAAEGAPIVPYSDASSDDEVTEITSNTAYGSPAFAQSPTPAVNACPAVGQSSQEIASPVPAQIITDTPDHTLNTSDTKDDIPNERPRTSRSTYRLPREEAGVVVNDQVTLLRKFYSIELNAKRDGPPFAEQTMTKLLERIYCFLNFCRHNRSMQVLTLDLFNDDTLIEGYVGYLSKVRKLMPNTITAHLTAAINVIKFNFREDRSALGSCNALSTCRSLQRQLTRQAKMISKRGKEGICMNKSSQRFYFNHILDTLRNLRAKIFESTGIEKARNLHDFVMIASYLRVSPGRSKEIRTLQVFVESEPNQFDAAKFVRANVIVFRYDKTVALYESDFKTVGSSGPRNIDLSEDRELVHHLHLYNSARPTLLQAKSHSHFFVNSYGEPFGDSSTLCTYLGNLFEREVSIRVSTNVLRHSIVTYFKTLEESKDVKIRESLATLMKHSVRYQEHTYDDATQHEKTQQGRQLLRTKLAPDIFGVADIVASASEGSARGAAGGLDEDEVVLRPHVGDICALLDPVSTAADISFFLAKVARYSSDYTEVQLVHLAQLEAGSEALFRLAPGKVWKESVDSLVYPIDVVYDASQQAYELRTSAKDIYNTVHGN